MKVIFDRDVLLSALIPAQGVVPGRNIQANIDGILLECPGEEPETCRISAYDLEKGMRCTIDCKILSEGKVIINTQKLLQIVRSFPEGEVELNVDEELNATISSGNGSFEISALKGDEFPMLPLLTGDRNYVLPQHELRNIFTRTVFAAAQNDSRPVFNGVYFKISEGKMTVVACDASRLALFESEAPENFAEASFIVPSKIILEFSKLVKDSEEEAVISVARKHVIFKLGEYNFFARLIDSEYLNYKRVIPESVSTEVFINKDELRSALERAMLITEDKLGGNYRTFVRMSFEGDILKVSSVSTSGRVYEEIPISKNGGDIVIGFNCRNMVETLRAFPDDVDTVKIGLNSTVLVAVLTDASGKYDKFLFIVSPVNMNR